MFSTIGYLQAQSQEKTPWRCFRPFPTLSGKLNHRDKFLKTVAEPPALTISLTWRLAVEDTRGGAFDHWLPPSSITGENSIAVLSTISDFVRKAQSPGQIPQNGG
jgi:hypothetical protein